MYKGCIRKGRLWLSGSEVPNQEMTGWFNQVFTGGSLLRGWRGRAETFSEEPAACLDWKPSGSSPVRRGALCSTSLPHATFFQTFSVHHKVPGSLGHSGFPLCPWKEESGCNSVPWGLKKDRNNIPDSRILHSCIPHYIVWKHAKKKENFNRTSAKQIRTRSGRLSGTSFSNR